MSEGSLEEELKEKGRGKTSEEKENFKNTRKKGTLI
jgi:hypothetical protein